LPLFHDALRLQHGFHREGDVAVMGDDANARHRNDGQNDDDRNEHS
jgi:hypothetical protein